MMLGFAAGRHFGSNFIQILPQFKTITRQVSGKLNLNEITGDVLAAPSNCSLVSSVAADLNLSSGMAARFTRAFNQAAELKSKKVKKGGVAVLNYKDVYIYYLVIKEHSGEKSTVETLRSSFFAMKEHMIRKKVLNLAMPRIGCNSVDGLYWDEVKDELYTVFGPDNICITVYHLVPKRVIQDE